MKYLLILIFVIFIITGIILNVYSKSYAIIISGGYSPENESDQQTAAYWYDVVLAYEYLREEVGYDPENIFVYFGDGNNWEGTIINNNRYNISEKHSGWGDIVNFNNYPETVEQISNLPSTSKDNLLVWLPRGHGYGSVTDKNSDEYTCGIRSPQASYPYYYEWKFTEYIDYSPDIPTKIIYNILKFKDSQGNKKYNRLKFLWSTCRSGHLVMGQRTLLKGGLTGNDDTKRLIITMTDYWEEGYLSSIQGGWYNENNEFINGSYESHSGLTYAIISTLKGEDPWGRPLENFEPDINNDGVINMKELWDAIKYKGDEGHHDDIWYDVSWDNGTGDSHIKPEISPNPDRDYDPNVPDDPCNRAEYWYIDENLKLENHTLSLMQGEEVRKYRVDKITAGNNLTIPSGSVIDFVVDTEVHFKHGFRAERGCKLHAYIGEINCP